MCGYGPDSLLTFNWLGWGEKTTWLCSLLDVGLAHLQSLDGTSADHSCPLARTCFFLLPARQEATVKFYIRLSPQQLVGHVRSIYIQRLIFKIYSELKAIAYMWKHSLQCLIVMEGITMPFRLLPHNL